MKPSEDESLLARPPILQIPRRALACLLGALFVIISASPSVKAGFVTGVLRGMRASAKMSTAKSDLLALTNCLAIYKLNAGVYPSSEQGLKALIDKPVTPPIPRQWMRLMDKPPVDPWGNPYQYRFPGKKDPTKFELSSNGKDGVTDTADDIRSDG